MTPEAILALMQEVSKNVQDIGRKIGSPKNDPDDLKKLADSLRYSAQTVDVIRDAFFEHYKKD